MKVLTLLCTWIHTAVVTNGGALSMIVERCIWRIEVGEEVSKGVHCLRQSWALIFGRNFDLLKHNISVSNCLYQKTETLKHREWKQLCFNVEIIGWDSPVSWNFCFNWPFCSTGSWFKFQNWQFLFLVDRLKNANTAVDFCKRNSRKTR